MLRRGLRKRKVCCFITSFAFCVCLGVFDEELTGGIIAARPANASHLPATRAHGCVDYVVFLHLVSLCLAILVRSSTAAG